MAFHAIAVEAIQLWLLSTFSRFQFGRTESLWRWWRNDPDCSCLGIRFVSCHLGGSCPGGISPVEVADKFILSPHLNIGKFVNHCLIVQKLTKSQ